MGSSFGSPRTRLAAHDREPCGPARRPWTWGREGPSSYPALRSVHPPSLEPETVSSNTGSVLPGYLQPQRRSGPEGERGPVCGVWFVSESIERDGEAERGRVTDSGGRQS